MSSWYISRRHARVPRFETHECAWQRWSPECWERGERITMLQLPLLWAHGLEVPCFNPRRVSYSDVVFATCGSYERDHVNSRYRHTFSARMFGATTGIASPQHCPFQPSFSQPTNPSANLSGNEIFTSSNVMQSSTETQQLPRSASVPRLPQGQAALANPPCVAEPGSTLCR